MVPLLSVAACLESDAHSAPATASAGLTLSECRQRMAAGNEATQIKMIEWLVSRQRQRGEKGVFEPEFVGAVERNENKRANTVEQARSQSLFGAGTVFDQKNNLYSAGIEALQPLGTRLRFGFTVSDFNNNLNQVLFPSGEYSSTMSLSVTQPLLKNAGRTVNTAAIRLAAIASDAAFQDYRRQFMQTIGGTESAYWELHLTQEQMRLTHESTKLAETILADNKARLAVGKATELEVLEAQAGVVLRQTRQMEAEQKVLEAAARLAAFMGEQVADDTTNATARAQVPFRATDKPRTEPVTANFGDCMTRALDANPDYLSRRRQIEASNIRLAYAKRQRWPQLDLKASYGLNGVGSSPAGSFDQLTHSDFPFWTLGLELRVPLEGGTRSKADLEAAKLATRQALLSLQEAETQLGNAIEISLRKAQTTSTTVTNLQSLAEYTKAVLEAQLDRHKAGKTDLRTVFETEAKLFEVRVAVEESLVQAERARLELGIVQGVVLIERELEVTSAELEERTANAFRAAGVSPQDATQLKRAAKDYYLLPSRSAAPAK
ncbi:MAG: TolC family protein [Limisphaerales bacterium]